MLPSVGGLLYRQSRFSLHDQSIEAFLQKDGDSLGKRPDDTGLNFLQCIEDG